MAVLVGHARLLRRAKAEKPRVCEEIGVSPLVRSARVLVALPLSSAPDKAAMLRRLLNAIHSVSAAHGRYSCQVSKWLFNRGYHLRKVNFTMIILKETICGIVR